MDKQHAEEERRMQNCVGGQDDNAELWGISFKAYT